MIVAGEYLVGGGQNRMVAASVYLAAGYHGTIPVRCVEHGRSRGRTREFGYGGHTNPSVKHSRSQDETWREVTTTLCEMEIRSYSEDFSQVIAQKDRDLSDIVERFAIHQDQVGIVAVIGLPDLKKYALEFFDDPEIMKKHYEKIIRALAVEALPHNNTRISVDKDEITQFISGIKSATLSQRHSASKGKDYEITTPFASGSTRIYEDNTTTYITLVSSKPFAQENTTILPTKKGKD